MFKFHSSSLSWKRFARGVVTRWFVYSKSILNSLQFKHVFSTAILILAPSALATPPDGFVGFGASVGEITDFRLEGGWNLLRQSYGVLGAAATVDIPTNFRAARVGLGGYWRSTVIENLDLFGTFGGRINNLDPFRGGFYLGGGAVVDLSSWFHLKPYYQFNFRESESRIGLAFEWQFLPPVPAPTETPPKLQNGVKLTEDWKIFPPF
jgi:hypothetical protein